MWYLYSYGLNELAIYTSGVSYVPYAYGTIIRTIRVWLYHMRIRVWYVPYAYGTEHTYVYVSSLAILQLSQLKPLFFILVVLTPFPLLQISYIAWVKL